MHITGPRKVTLTQGSVGTRYVLLAVRTFADPNDKQDLKEAYRPADLIAHQLRFYSDGNFFHDCYIGSKYLAFIVHNRSPTQFSGIVPQCVLQIASYVPYLLR